MSSFLQGTLTPGSRQFMLLLNSVLLLLIIVLAVVLYAQLEDSIHVFVMLFLALGLLVSINWFVIEANRLRDEQLSGSNSNNNAPSKPQATATRAKTD